MLTQDSASMRVHVPTSRIVQRTRRKRSRANPRFIIAGIIVFAAIGFMIYSAISSGSEYYVTTGELLAMGDEAVGQQMKMGGRVADGSIQWDKGSGTVSFRLADEQQRTLPITYTGVVPDAFQPNADLIMEGKLGTDGTFRATTMLAKCASKYEPAT